MAFVGDINFKQYGIDFVYDDSIKVLPDNIRIYSVEKNYIRGKINFKFLDFEQKEVANFNILKDRNGSETRLGGGTFGTTYQLENKIENMNLAIKEIAFPENIYIHGNKTRRTNEEIRKKKEDYIYDVVKEAILHVIVYESSKDKTNGPFCPKPFFIGRTDDKFYMVSELLTDTLNKLLSTNDTIKPIWIVKSIRDLALILKELYTVLRFNHCDLHAKNVMYKKKPFQIRIIDFGLSNLTYRNLVIHKSKYVLYAQNLNSIIRDMHQFLYELKRFEQIKELVYNPFTYALERTSKTNPLDRICNILCVTDYSKAANIKFKTAFNRAYNKGAEKQKNWAETYTVFDEKNTIDGPDAALNCAPAVVHKIFSELDDKSMDLYAPVAPTWTKHLKKLYIDAAELLTDDEYSNVTDAVKEQFILPFLKKNIVQIYARNISPTFLISDVKYTLSSGRRVFDGPAKYIDELFDDFISLGGLYTKDAIKETLLFKLVRLKKEEGEAKLSKAFDILKTGDNWKNLVFFHKNNEEKTVYDIAEPWSKVPIDNLSISYLKTILATDRLDRDDAKVIAAVLTSDTFKKEKDIMVGLLSSIIRKDRFDSNCIDGLIKALDSESLESYSINIGGTVYNFLELAIVYNNIDAAENLLESGANFSSYNNKVGIFFDLCNLKSYDEKIHSTIIEKYADKKRINLEDVKGNTPLMIAARDGNLSAVKAFIKVPGIIFSKQNKEGNTALHLATGSHKTDKKIYKDIIRELIQAYPALADIKNLEGQGPGNPKWVWENNYRPLVKPSKSTLFKSNPDPEKPLRAALTKKGGRQQQRQRKTRRRR